MLRVGLFVGVLSSQDDVGALRCCRQALDRSQSMATGWAWGDGRGAARVVTARLLGGSEGRSFRLQTRSPTTPQNNLLAPAPGGGCLALGQNPELCTPSLCDTVYIQSRWREKTSAGVSLESVPSLIGPEFNCFDYDFTSAVIEYILLFVHGKLIAIASYL